MLGINLSIIIIESIKHNASIVGKCKININSNIKHLWKIVVND